MEIRFLSSTKFEIIDGEHKIISDQPKTSGGTDEGMNPVNIFIGSLGACIAIFISHLLVRRNVNLSECSIKLKYEIKDNPRRVGKISAEIILPRDLSDNDKKAILKAANLCTVHNTLHHPPEISIRSSV